MVMRSTVCHVEQAIRHQDETPLADALALLRALLVLKTGIYKKACKCNMPDHVDVA